MIEDYEIPSDNFSVDTKEIPRPTMTVNNEKPDANGNVDVEGGGPIDPTLSHEGEAADAKATGDAISQVNSSIADGLQSLNNLKAAGLVSETKDTNTAYQKTVPADALPEAVINSVSGRTLNWNQGLHPLTIDYSTDDWSITSDESGKVTLVANAAHDFTNDSQNIASTGAGTFADGHKYYLKDGGNTVHLYFKAYNTAMNTVVTIETAQYSNIRMWGSVSAAGTYYLYPQIFDLTEMFGAGNEPTADECAVMFAEDYYPYAEPTETTYAPAAIISGDKTYPIGTMPMQIEVTPNGTLTFVSDHPDVHVALQSSVSFASSISPTFNKAADTTFTIAANETHIVTGTPTALNVTLAAPAADKDSMYGLMFKAGASFALTDTAPTGYSIVWADEPTWEQGKVYEIIYRYLHLDGIISAKYAEAVAEVSA